MGIGIGVAIAMDFIQGIGKLIQNAQNQKTEQMEAEQGMRNTASKAMDSVMAKIAEVSEAIGGVTDRQSERAGS